VDGSVNRLNGHLFEALLDMESQEFTQFRQEALRTATTIEAICTGSRSDRSICTQDADRIEEYQRVTMPSS